MHKFTLGLLVIAIAVPVTAQQKEGDRLKESAQVLKEIVGMPE